MNEGKKIFQVEKFSQWEITGEILHVIGDDKWLTYIWNFQRNLYELVGEPIKVSELVQGHFGVYSWVVQCKINDKTNEGVLVFAARYALIAQYEDGNFFLFRRISQEFLRNAIKCCESQVTIATK